MHRAARGQDTSNKPVNPTGPRCVRARQVRPFQRSARLRPTPELPPAKPTAMQLDGPAQSTPDSATSGTDAVARRYVMTTSILVTGGTGTLGRPVAQRLRDAGAGVTVLSRRPS